MSRHHTKRRGNGDMTARVLAQYGTDCWLRLPGCRGLATTRDHVIPLASGGLDVLENCRPACQRCNSKRQDKIVSGTGGANVVVVTGPPAAGKSTYVREHAAPSDVVIDLDALARAIMPHPPERTHVYPDYVRMIAIRARRGAIEYAARLTARITVWLIHAVPKPDQIAEYRALRYRIVTIDPGRAIVEARALELRPPAMRAAVARWYSTHPDPATQPPPTPTPTPALTAAPSGARPW